MLSRTPLALALGLVLLAGCECGGSTGGGGACASDSDCSRDQVCRDGRCVPRPDAAPPGDTGPDAIAPPDDGGGCASPCGSDCCEGEEICIGGATCAIPGPSCADDDECSDDSYCDEGSGTCLPWETATPATDPTCSRLIIAGTFAPTVQCRFDEAPAGDAFPAHLHVLSTPMVVDFGIDAAPDAPRRPAIVATFDDGVDGGSEEPTGVIRILDGATCIQQWELGSLQLASHSSPPAVGDLDGDGRAEIVAFKAGGGLVAYRYLAGSRSWEVFWRSTSDGATPYDVTGSAWAGPSIYDLDDDGVPEVLRGGIVFDNNGVLVDDSLGRLPYSAGIFPVVADVDEDGKAELIAGHGAWEWDPAGSTWVAETWSAGGTAAGHVALADFGDFPGATGWPADAPEVAVVSSGTVRVQTLDNQIVFGPVTIPGGGTGGPPTVADFDGDGRPEVASAGANAYVVFDLDCGAAPVGTCASATTTGVLWSQRSQDGSSNVTGSSVFDFEGDGRAEAVYGDECFLRVYDGETGEVVFSQARSSCTWYENPVVADLDGDFNAEIVLGDNYNCGDASSGRDCSGFGLDTRSTDPLFAGLRCSEGADCLSGTCDAGFCRCTTDDECCAGLGCDDAAFVCVAPPAGTPGTGNTCRASRPIGTLGIRVYRDAADRWVRSRMIWNQHAYHVTNVNDDGTVPRTSEARLNWKADGLNNFRQNVQGTADPDAAPDLTSRLTPMVCDAEGALLRSSVCNRGTEPVSDGVTVAFYDGDPDAGGALLCTAATATVLDPAECETVECRWATPPTTEPGVDVTVVADADGTEGECLEGNNRSVVPGVFCAGLE